MNPATIAALIASFILDFSLTDNQKTRAIALVLINNREKLMGTAIEVAQRVLSAPVLNEREGIYRAQYAILSFTRRLLGHTNELQEDVYFRQHLEAGTNRERAEKESRAVAEANGTQVLIWRAIIDEKTTPDCIALDGVMLYER